ncbi:hypothetical protein [Roseateles sp. BYS87W]|uniref:Uncharacterized protein n=1 Tax=Pelomonas baiyunensis TaxID=3299026 RepID=A0ABW7H0U9_9BURK
MSESFEQHVERYAADSRAIAAHKARKVREVYPATTPERIEQLQAIREVWRTHSHETQVSMLIDAIVLGPLIPHECRTYMGMPNPSEIVRLANDRLRHHGVMIHSTPATRIDELGNARPTTVYELAYD